MSMSRGSPRFRLAVVAVLALTACSAGDGGVQVRRSEANVPGETVRTDATSDTTAATEITTPLVDAAGNADSDQLAAMVTAFGELPVEQQALELAALDARTERQIWTLNGVDEALGGAAAADAEFVGLYGAFADQRAELAQRPIVIAALRVDATAEGLGAALFGSMMAQQLFGQGAVDASNDGRSGSKTAGGLSITATAGNDISASYETSTTYGGATLHINTSVKVNPCPDAAGTVEVTSTTMASSAAGGTSSSLTMEVHSSIQVDDNAEVAGSTYDYHVTRQDTSASGAQHTMDIRVGADHRVTIAFRSWFESAELYSNTLQLAAFLAAFTNRFNVEAAKSGWQSGRCIDLQTSVSDGPTGLNPNARVTITAKPRAKSDRASAGGTVSAMLTGGEAAIDPSATPMPADAEFTYTAPGERDKAGQVSLESRSRRGVGKAVVNLDTTRASAFSASGGAQEWTATGTICSLEAPFVLDGSGLTATATPTGDAGGTYTLTGDAGGATWDGSGTYTVALSDDQQSGTLTLNGVNNVHSEFGDFSAAAMATFALVAIDPC
ncbi:MAG: hypothetical protein ABMA25_05320 [Ilumatobacteraceae bacterium]